MMIHGVTLREEDHGVLGWSRDGVEEGNDDVVEYGKHGGIHHVVVVHVMTLVQDVDEHCCPQQRTMSFALSSHDGERRKVRMTVDTYHQQYGRRDIHCHHLPFAREDGTAGGNDEDGHEDEDA